MKHLFAIVCVLIVACSSMRSQEITVKSFEQDLSDLMASTHRRNDLNGQPCALVKVQLTRPGAVFEGNVFGNVQYSHSEYYVYMSSGSKMLKVKLGGYLPLVILFSSYNKDIASVQGLTTYRLILSLPENAANTTTSIRICPDDNHPHQIDLGLPSGTMWSCCNIGAMQPEDYGNYYAWGETKEKKNYLEETYKYRQGVSNYVHIGDDISGTPYDVAHQEWGDPWALPSSVQIKELQEKCSRTWTTYGGVNGILVTGPSGKSIFLPAAGARAGSVIFHKKTNGLYWSSSLLLTDKSNAHSCDFNSDSWGVYSDYRNNGRSVRAVSASPIDSQEEKVEVLLCPDGNHPHQIDLGLPSGIKWSCCNVGASSPEEYGGYYPWGETEEQVHYRWDNYSHYDSASKTCYKIGDDIAGTEYDVAHVKWGKAWRMPSPEQIKELKDNCTTKWTSYKGINGKLVKGKNGNQIFLPASGYRLFENLNFRGEIGEYWTSKFSSKDIMSGIFMFIESRDVRTMESSRCSGQSVRPVCP